MGSQSTVGKSLFERVGTSRILTLISLKGSQVYTEGGWRDSFRTTGHWTQLYGTTKLAWHPVKYMKGQLAESWEFKNLSTHIVHLRKGIHWQNIPPANGREFVAEDVVFHYNRLLGLGDYPNPSPFPVGIEFQNLVSVTATDKYTVVFEWKTPNHEFIMETLHGVMQRQCIENPEAVIKWGNLSDWHHAIGTGPFILKDFVSGISATLRKNPDYWGYDERYKNNKLPYVDTVKYLVIPDDNTALEAMSAGNIDIIDRVSLKQAQVISKTNPEIVKIYNPGTQAVTIQPRNDREPFNDVRVRKAMQLAIDLPAIAKGYYHGTVEPYPSTVLSNYLSRAMNGWGFPYEEWPQDLKEEYSYSPTTAKQLLYDAGYPRGFKTNIIADTASDIELLQLIKYYFAGINIDMEIRPMESNACMAFVADQKHDQMVYRQYGPLGHCYAPFQAITRFWSGASNNIQMVSDPVIDSYFVKALAAATESELKRIVKDMNNRVAKQHFTISLLQPAEYALCQPWIKGYHGQIHSIWMGVGGPSRLSLYGARFWIDRNIQKSI